MNAVKQRVEIRPSHAYIFRQELAELTEEGQ